MPDIDADKVKAYVDGRFVEPRLAFSMKVPQHHEGKRWFFSNGIVSVGDKVISTLHLVGQPNHWNYNPQSIQRHASVTDSLTLVAEVSPATLRFIERKRNAGDVHFQLELYFHKVRYEVKFSADHALPMDNLFLSDDVQQESIQTKIHRSEWARKFLPQLSGRAYHLLEIPEIALSQFDSIFKEPKDQDRLKKLSEVISADQELS